MSKETTPKAGALLRTYDTSTKRVLSPSDKQKAQASDSGSSPPKKCPEYENLKSSEKFAEWFWTVGNATPLIDYLNKYPNKDKDSLVYLGSHDVIYGVVVTDIIDRIHFETTLFDEIINNNLKLVKVGQTKRTSPAERPEEIKRELKNKNYHGEVLFSVIAGFRKKSSLNEVEKAVREYVGIVLDDDFVRRLKLPFKTEWVLTTDQYTKDINEKERNTTEDLEKCNHDSIKRLGSGFLYFDPDTGKVAYLHSKFEQPIRPKKT